MLVPFKVYGRLRVYVREYVGPGRAKMLESIRLSRRIPGMGYIVDLHPIIPDIRNDEEWHKLFHEVLGTDEMFAIDFFDCMNPRGVYDVIS